MRSIQQTLALRRRQDAAFNVLGILCTAVGVVTLGALLVSLAIDGLTRIDWQFLTSLTSYRPARAGIAHALLGSILVVLVTVLAAVPIGVATGVYLEEYAPKNRLTAVIEVNIANLAGVPSVIFGLMALSVFVYVFGFGASILTAGLTLAALILPIVIVATREALRTIPRAIREASYALGATKWETVRHHLLPYSLGGIATGVIIGVSRAIGETAPLVVVGAVVFTTFLPVDSLSEFFSLSWLQQPFSVMPIQMYNWVSMPNPAFHENAAAAGIMLIVITLGMNACAIYVRSRMRRRIKW